MLAFCSTEATEMGTSTANAKRAPKAVTRTTAKRAPAAAVKGTAYGREVIKVLHGFKGGPFRRPA